MFDTTDEWIAVTDGKVPGDIYSRIGNPTVRVFEEKVRLLESAEAGIAFASGMAAISTVFFALLKPGDSVVSTRDTYGGTSKMFLDILPRWGIGVRLVETTDRGALLEAVSQKPTMVYIESPTNPTLKVIDIAAVAQAARRCGCITVIDSTFATPINQRPMLLGVDLVLHSATKFLGGHDDALGGVAAGRADLVDQVRKLRDISGAALAPFSAYLLLRGLKTLALRVVRQNDTAMRIARMLSGHPKIIHVNYPGLESHPGHEVAKAQMTGFGGVLSFQLNTDFEGVKRFLDSLQLAQRGPSLGSVNTLAGPPATTSHVECTQEQRASLGIPEELVRYSCGVEDAEDLISDLQCALSLAL